MPNTRGRELLGSMLEIKDQDTLERLIQGLREQRFRYILTFDMGDGNSSRAIIKYTLQKQSDGTCKKDFTVPQLLQWEYNRRTLAGRQVQTSGLSLPTIIGYDYHGSPIIGPEALEIGQVAQNFKTVPTPDALEKQYRFGNNTYTLKKIWADYFRLAFQDSLKKAREKFPDISDSNVLFVVARPASKDWEAYLDAYRALIAEGTGLQQCQIITFSEAKAAIQYVRSRKIANGESITIDWSKGVLVIDLGASTIDVAFLKRGIGAPIEASIKMAGQNVDRLLGHFVLSQVFSETSVKLGGEADELPDDDFFTKHQKKLKVFRGQFSHSARSIKEEICKSGNSQTVSFGGKNIALDVETLTDLIQKESFTLGCENDPGFGAFVNNGTFTGHAFTSWSEHLKSLVVYMLRKSIPKELESRGLETSLAPAHVIVTGGTANLVGIGETVRGGVVLGCGNDIDMEVLNRAEDYERTVPFGSAYYIQEVISGMDTVLAAPEQIKTALSKDLEGFAPVVIRKKLYPVVEKKINAVLDYWESPDRTGYDASVANLENKLKSISFTSRELRQPLNVAAQEIQNMISAWNSQDPGEMKNTDEAIQKFLQELANDPEYHDSVTCSNIKLTLSPEGMSAAIVKSIPGTFSRYASGVFWLNAIFQGPYAPLWLSTRRSIVAGLRRASPFYEGILPAIKSGFAADFENTDGFGLVDSIMDILERKINNILFLR